MDAVTFTAVKTRRTMTVFLIVVIVPFLMTVFIGIAKVRELSSSFSIRCYGSSVSSMHSTRLQQYQQFCLNRFGLSLPAARLVLLHLSGGRPDMSSRDSLFTLDENMRGDRTVAGFCVWGRRTPGKFQRQYVAPN